MSVLSRPRPDCADRQPKRRHSTMCASRFGRNMLGTSLGLGTVSVIYVLRITQQTGFTNPTDTRTQKTEQNHLGKDDWPATLEDTSARPKETRESNDKSTCQFGNWTVQNPVPENSQRSIAVAIMMTLWGSNMYTTKYTIKNWQCFAEANGHSFIMFDLDTHPSAKMPSLSSLSPL